MQTHARPRPERGPARGGPGEVRDAVARALAVLHPPGTPFEVRLLGVTIDKYTRDKTYAGYFDCPDAAADAVAPFDDVARGAYVTLNPVDPRLLARYYRRLERAPRHTTGDGDVPRRRRLLVDADPVRPSGVPSTDAEHRAAVGLAREIAGFLDGRGWPPPLVASSGNGAHLVYGLDLPADDGGLVKRALRSLDLAFSDGAVAVDTAVANPARLTKAYGTTTRKGDHCPHLGMPHRRSSVLDAPDELEAVDPALVHDLADLFPTNR